MNWFFLRWILIRARLDEFIPGTFEAWPMLSGFALLSLSIASFDKP